jgi:hypothetical protein
MTTIRLLVELEPDTQPISGTYSLGDADPIEFVGVLELLSAIESTRAGGSNTEQDSGLTSDRCEE